ncbi:hypothetical protein [Phyllobacterium ifriqiyense]|uniref:hypothetical protein n=1 Tax=Phyllobacterium ifriqiyense TaxID=314238 RepID=UPI00339A14EC
MTGIEPLSEKRAQEKFVSFSIFQKSGDTSSQARVMTEAQNLASVSLNRHPKKHEYGQRLAHTIMSFYHRRMLAFSALWPPPREKSLESRKNKDICLACSRCGEEGALFKAAGFTTGRMIEITAAFSRAPRYQTLRRNYQTANKPPRRRREREIPGFGDEVIRTGCCNISDGFYVMGDADIPDDEYDEVVIQLGRTMEKYGDREPLRHQSSRTCIRWADTLTIRILRTGRKIASKIRPELFLDKLVRGRPLARPSFNKFCSR